MNEINEYCIIDRPVIQSSMFRTRPLALTGARGIRMPTSLALQLAAPASSRSRPPARAGWCGSADSHKRLSTTWVWCDYHIMIPMSCCPRSGAVDGLPLFWCPLYGVHFKKYDSHEFFACTKKCEAPRILFSLYSFSARNWAVFHF